VSATIDQEPFATEQDLDSLEQQLGGQSNAGGEGAAKRPAKQFPLMLFLGGFGVFVAILALAFVLTLKHGPSNQDQMQSIPQPQMGVPAPQSLPPLPQGGIPRAAQGGQQAWPSAQPGGNPAQITQVQQAQPGMVQPQGVQPVQGATPDMTAPAPMAVGPSGAALEAQPAVAQPSPVQPAVSPTTAEQYAQQAPAPVAAVRHKRGNAASDGTGAQPVGAEPTAAPKYAGTPVVANQQQIAEIRRQLAALTTRLNQLGASDGDSTQAQADDSGDSTAPTQPKSEKHRDHARAAHKGKGAKVAKADASAGQDSGYVLTGMIDNRAFVSRKGSGDVNASLTLAPGDKLDDGRKVVQVDAKNRRVWLSGGKYIGLPADSGASSSDDQSGSSDQ
jgi:hypothetical protein